MASASAAPSTPFFTSTPNKAATFAFPGAAVRLAAGVGLAGTAAASLVLAALAFAGFASLPPAISGTAVTASTSRLHNNCVIVDMDGLSSFSPPSSGLGTNRGSNLGLEDHKYCGLQIMSMIRGQRTSVALEALNCFKLEGWRKFARGAVV